MQSITSCSPEFEVDMVFSHERASSCPKPLAPTMTSRCYICLHGMEINHRLHRTFVQKSLNVSIALIKKLMASCRTMHFIVDYVCARDSTKVRDSVVQNVGYPSLCGAASKDLKGTISPETSPSRIPSSSTSAAPARNIFVSRSQADTAHLQMTQGAVDRGF